MSTTTINMSSDGPCRRFNNAGQAVGGTLAKPVVWVWETNDPDCQWSAQARLVSLDGKRLIRVLGNGSAPRMQDAKDMAARQGYEVLRAIYPDLNL